MGNLRQKYTDEEWNKLQDGIKEKENRKAEKRRLKFEKFLKERNE